MEPETKARAPERALRQYLAHALEQPQPNCTRSAGCLDRFLAKGLDNYPPSPPLKTKPSRCLLFEQLLSGCRRKQERLLVPDLATNWFRKQKIYVDKLSAEELAALSSGLASRDESHCLEERKCPEQPKKNPDGGGLVSAECLPITGPKSRNPFLMDSGATLEERQTNCLLGSKDTTKEGSRDCLSPRRTEPMLNRRKNDLRKAPHRRLDPAAFRRISPEFFCLLDAYETAMSESCPLYGIPMDSWDERKVSSVEEEAWQKQHCLGDEAVATAVVSPYRLAGQNSRPPEEEEEEEMQLEKASSKWREDKEDQDDREVGEEKVMKQEMENERRNSKKRRVSLVSQEPQQKQEWKDIQPCNSETCSARGEMVSFCSYQERPRRRYKTQNSLSNYSSVRSGYEEERQLELQQKQDQLKQQQEQIQLEQQEKQEQLKQQQEQLQMELQEKQEQLKEQQEQLKQQQEQLEQQQQQLQEQLEGTTAAPKRPSKTPKKRRCNWCSCFRPSTTMQFRNAYSNAYLPGLYAQAPPKPRLLRTPSLPPAPPSPNLYLMPHQRLPPTASSLYTPLSSGCTLCSASNRKKHILGGLTGLCKRVTNPGRHLLYNLHHNRAKYVKKQEIQPKRHLNLQEGLDQAGVPQLFISTPAPCTWKKVKRKLPETDQAKEMQAEDSTTTLKPSVYEEEEEQQQQQEELSKLTSDQSLNFHTPPSECTLAGLPQVPGDSRSSVSFEQEPARTLSITHHQCKCDWSSRDTQDIPTQADASGYNHQGQPSRSRKSKPNQAAAYLPNETQESANEEFPPRAPKLTMPRRQSLYTLHPFSGFRPRGLHWGNDYQQLMQRVARPRLNNRRIKRKKISDQVAPKTKPKPRVPSQPKPKPTPKPKTKLKPKPKVASATTAPAQNTQDPHPQPTNDDPPRLCSQQSSMNPIQICRRQSTKTLLEDPSPAQPEPSDCACQSQAESPMSSEQSSMDFVSCVTTSKSQDQRGIPSTESHSDSESQTVTEQSSFVSMVCKCAQQDEIPQENPRKCATPSTSTFSEEPSPPKQKITCRSPTPRRRERKPNSYQTLKSLEQPSQGRTTSCGSSSSGGRMQRERSSSNYRQSETSACHRPKRCQDNDRPCRRNATTKTKEVSMASFWSQRRRRPFCSPWADYERSHQSLHSKASSGCSCWPQQNPSQDVPSSRPSFRRRCLPNQWLPPANAFSSGHASQRSSFETTGQVYNYAPIQPMLSFAPMQPETSLEAAQPAASSVQPSEHITRGRRYYTETQPGRATGNKFSCRSMHTTCSIRALSSNTDSMRCPCAPAPSVASVEPPPEEEEEEEQQQYYRPCPPSPPDSGFKICSNKTSFLKNTMRWEEQEHRYTHTRLRTKRPPPDEYYSSGNNSFYRPEPPSSYQRWDNDFYCQPGQESFPDARPWHQPYTYALGHQVQPDFNSLNAQRADREGAIAAAAQGLRGLVQAMGGPRHRSRHSRCSLDSCYQPQTGRGSSWLGHQPQRESLTSGSYYSRESGAGERTWSSREASAARFSRGSTAKRSAREGRRGPDSGAFISFGSGMDFRGEPFASPRTMCSRSRRRRTGGSSRVKKVEHEQEEKPTALAIFLDELKAKHDATQCLDQGRSPPGVTEQTCRESSSSEDCADPSKRMAIPTTYTGLLEEQIINEYLPRPRYKRRT